MAKGSYLAIFILLSVAFSTPTSAQGGYSISENGLTFIADHEGIRYNLYDDPAGHCTIGFGHLVHNGNCDGSATSEKEFLGGISRDQAFELLKSDVAIAEQDVNSQVTVPLTQSQFDALVSFAYNLGGGNLATMLSDSGLNEGQYDAVPQELNRWIYGTVNGKKQVLPGLRTRRLDEGTLFQSEGLASAVSKQVTLTLYVHEGSKSGPIIPGATVTGQDGSGTSFQQTTDSNGCVIITGESGTWSFTASADGYEANSWSQPITYTDTKDGFLTQSVTQSSKSSGFSNSAIAELRHNVESGSQQSDKKSTKSQQQETVTPITQDSESSVVGKWATAYSDCDCNHVLPDGSTSSLHTVMEADDTSITEFHEDGTFTNTQYDSHMDITIVETGKWTQNGNKIWMEYDHTSEKGSRGKVLDENNLIHFEDGENALTCEGKISGDKISYVCDSKTALSNGYSNSCHCEWSDNRAST